MSTGPEVGVYYEKSCYLPFWKRLLIGLTDIVVLTLLLVVMVATMAAGIVFTSFLTESMGSFLVFNIFGVTAGLYMTVLKRSRFRTAGYRLFAARIVNFQGRTPNLYAMFVRFLFVVLGPFNFLLDLVWIPGDECRQALRDKLAHTYVIRSDAVPSGQAPIKYSHYDILGWTFTFGEVGIPETEYRP